MTEIRIVDTTVRDGHQSLWSANALATAHIAEIAPTVDRVGYHALDFTSSTHMAMAVRWQREDPWERLARLRERTPNLLLQMLLRGANAVGYTNYPDNVVRFFVARAAAPGIDVFRLSDSLNWVENMRLAIDAVLESGKLCEPALCYSGNLSDPREIKYTLGYYLKLARELGVVQRKDARGEKRGVRGAADRHRRDRDAGRHLRDREQRVEPVEGARLDRDADHRQVGLRRNHSREMRRAARAGDDDFDPAPLRLARVLEHQVRRAMGRDDAQLARDAQLLQGRRGGAHRLEVGRRAHDDPDAGASVHRPRRSGRS